MYIQKSHKDVKRRGQPDFEAHLPPWAKERDGSLGLQKGEVMGRWEVKKFHKQWLLWLDLKISQHKEKGNYNYVKW